jgi:hypothetical protein
MGTMTDAQINQYLVEVRKWPKRPTDYDEETERIIRAILKGEIDVGAETARQVAEAESAKLHEPAASATGTAADWQKRDAIGNYELALEAIRHKDDKP